MDALTVILIFYASVLCSFCNRGRKSKKGRYEYESSSQEFDRNSFAEPSISSNESYIDRFNREVTAIHQHSYEEQGTGSITEAIGEMEHGGERGIYDFTYLSHSSSRASSKDDVYDQGDNFSQKSS